MLSVFAKLNLNNQREVVVLDAPASFAAELVSWNEIKVVRDLETALPVKSALVFVTQKSQVARWSKSLAARASGDAMLWFAYPKGTSRQFKCDFNRDNGFDAMRELGWDTVRQIAVDADWSALRFRRTEFIQRRP